MQEAEDQPFKGIGDGLVRNPSWVLNASEESAVRAAQLVATGGYAFLRVSEHDCIKSQLVVQKVNSKCNS